MDNTLDCRGLNCPEPVIRCRALLGNATPDKMIVLVDNKAALENVSRFLERKGFLVASSPISESEWRIVASHSGSAPMMETDPAQKTACDKTLVLLTAETLGRGDDELGAKLMLTFLANLSELGNSLWRIILLNGAVKLCAKEGEALNKLQELANSGVDVFVCGTCLMHYGLLEKKQVGETTNMMDVVTSMALAQKIIRF